MFANPFTPIFGGKPEFFFGRKEILQRFDIAMIERGSEDRALFFTGTRGSGKTALLEQLSIRASAKRRRVIDLGPDDTVAQLVRTLVGHDETTRTISPQANLSILGIGGGISAGSVSRTTHVDRASLQQLLLDACARAEHGLLVTIDEIQKVPIDDVSALCNAFQMASRKGHDIMLAAAGLPFAYERIIHHEGCTYLRRSSHEELGLFSWDEAADAFKSSFARVDGVVVPSVCIDALNRASYGHPYLMQLLGYHLVAQLNADGAVREHEVSQAEVDEVVPRAVLVYERRALRPLLEELSATERAYLQAMSACLDERRVAQTARIAESLGKEQRSLSQARRRLIDKGIIAPFGHGFVSFCIPYLASYVLREATQGSAAAVARSRMV